MKGVYRPPVYTKGMRVCRLPSQLEMLPTGQQRRVYFIEATHELVVYGHPVDRSPEYRLCTLRPGDQAKFSAEPLDPAFPHGPFKWVLVRKIVLES